MSFDAYRFHLEGEIEEIDRLEEGGYEIDDHPAYFRDRVLNDTRGKYSYRQRRDILKKKLANHIKKQTTNT